MSPAVHSLWGENMFKSIVSKVSSKVTLAACLALMLAGAVDSKTVWGKFTSPGKECTVQMPGPVNTQNKGGSTFYDSTADKIKYVIMVQVRPQGGTDDQMLDSYINGFMNTFSGKKSYLQKVSGPGWVGKIYSYRKPSGSFGALQFCCSKKNLFSLMTVNADQGSPSTTTFFKSFAVPTTP
jgi:hypothetical protein